MKPKNAAKKKISAVTTASVMLAASLLLCFLSSCGISNPPSLSAVYDRLVYLIEGSQTVNTFLFGEGLPVYEYGSAYAELNMIYYNSQVDAEYVSMHASYLTEEEMRQEAAKYYSAEYLESVLETCFVGAASEDSVLPARYTESGTWLSQSMSVTPLIHGRRVYDYASMKIVRPSSRDYLTVSISSYVEEHPETCTVYTLSFIWENENWYLDAPSY